MLSTSIFNSNGTRYSQSAVFTGPGQSLNETALAEVGLPALTGSNAWANLMANVSVRQSPFRDTHVILIHV